MLEPTGDTPCVAIDLRLRSSSLGCSLARAAAAEFPTFQAQEIDPHAGKICYAVTVADVNGDQKPDVVAVTEDAVVWYENPSWRKHDIIRKATARDNVCIQPHDIDGDGRVDFALGAGWRPPDTKNPSTLQWLGRDARGPLAGPPDPLRRADAAPAPLGRRERDAGKKQLVVAALAGTRHQGPELGGRGGRARPRLRRPREPGRRRPGRSRSPISSLHTIHNLQLIDLDGDGRDEIVVARLGGRVRARPRLGRALDQDPDRHRQPGVEPVQGVERGQGRPLAERRLVHRHDRALARLPGRRLHAPGVDGRSDRRGRGTAPLWSRR